MKSVKYMNERREANGTTYWVFNPPRYLREALKVSYERFENWSDCKEYCEQVALAYEDHKRLDKTNNQIVRETVAGLWATYKTTNAWTRLAPNSRRTYRMCMEKALDLCLADNKKPIGAWLAKSLTSMHAEQLYAYLKKHVSEHRANHTIKVFRRVWNVALSKGLVRVNPFLNMGLRTLPPRLILWEPEQVAKFIKTADDLNLSSIGTIALMCYDMCQRPGDMRQMTWDSYNGQEFDFVQEKTKERVTIPASPRLRDRLEQHRNNHTHVAVYEVTGKAHDRWTVYKTAAKVRQEAGLPADLQIRDLRRTGATEMAEAGVTEDELRAVTGHKSRGILNTYVRPTRKLAINGMMKRFG